MSVLKFAFCDFCRIGYYPPRTYSQPRLDDAELADGELAGPDARTVWEVIVEQVSAARGPFQAKKKLGQTE